MFRQRWTPRAAALRTSKETSFFWNKKETAVPIVRVELLSGRAPELKAKAAKEITEVMTKTFGVAADQTFVIFVDVERHDWAIGGRTLSPTS